MGGALVTLLSSAGQASAHAAVPNDPFVLLLKGVYSKVGTDAPNLGLNTVDLRDGTYSRTKIYPVFGLTVAPVVEQVEAIGNFFVQIGHPAPQHCAYQLPGGAMAMLFTNKNVIVVPDGSGGAFIRGTFDLTVIEATGIFAPFGPTATNPTGGHNHMVDDLHKLSSGAFDEFCFCNVSTFAFLQHDGWLGGPSRRLERHPRGVVRTLSRSRSRTRNYCGFPSSHTRSSGLIGARVVN